MNIRVLAFEGCPNDQPTLALIRDVLTGLGVEASVERVEVTPETCDELRFLGSPTVQIDGVDIEPAARVRIAYGISCRTYPGNGGAPTRQMVEDAIAERVAAAKDET